MRLKDLLVKLRIKEDNESKSMKLSMESKKNMVKPKTSKWRKYYDDGLNQQKK